MKYTVSLCISKEFESSEKMTKEDLYQDFLNKYELPSDVFFYSKKGKWVVDDIEIIPE